MQLVLRGKHFHVCSGARHSGTNSKCVMWLPISCWLYSWRAQPILTARKWVNGMCVKHSLSRVQLCVQGADPFKPLYLPLFKEERHWVRPNTKPFLLSFSWLLLSGSMRGGDGWRRGGCIFPVLGLGINVVVAALWDTATILFAPQEDSKMILCRYGHVNDCGSSEHNSGFPRYVLNQRYQTANC